MSDKLLLIERQIYGIQDTTVRRLLTDLVLYLKEKEKELVAAKVGHTKPVDAVGIPPDSEKGKVG